MCCNRSGVRKDAKIVTNTKRLSTERLFSSRYDVIQTMAGPRPKSPNTPAANTNATVIHTTVHRRASPSCPRGRPTTQKRSTESMAAISKVKDSQNSHWWSALTLSSRWAGLTATRRRVRAQACAGEATSTTRKLPIGAVDTMPKKQSLLQMGSRAISCNNWPCRTRLSQVNS